MDIFKNFKASLKIRDVLVDNNVFQLHYRVTALMLLVCAALVASKQHFGDPISCITRDDVPNKMMDTYCWIHATFTLPGACNKTVGVEVAHPCVDKFNQGNEERVYHKYYQWVYFVLFFQAASFYAPHYFWKKCESNLLKNLTDKLRYPLFKDKDRFKQARRVARYMYRTRNKHQNYYHTFVLFEAANLLNVFLQMYVVDEFLGGTFTNYGLEVIRYSQLEQEERLDPMVRVFPRMTKCTFHRFGSSGDVQRHDALCLLPLNIINEKIYIMMWFWFVFLTIVTSCWLVYRTLTFFKPKMRHEVLLRRASLVDSCSLRRVLRRSSTGDWFLLCMMSKNMDSQWFRFILKKYSMRLRRRLLRQKKKEDRLRNGYSSPINNNNNNDDHKRGDAEELILDDFNDTDWSEEESSDSEYDDDDIDSDIESQSDSEYDDYTDGVGAQPPAIGANPKSSSAGAAADKA